MGATIAASSSSLADNKIAGDRVKKRPLSSGLVSLFGLIVQRFELELLAAQGGFVHQTAFGNREDRHTTATIVLLIFSGYVVRVGIGPGRRRATATS
jgi:hypothetical protein